MAEGDYDVIIMGGGPAGLTAGIYTARHDLKTLLIEGKQMGGKAWGEHRIENYPGFSEGITGSELMERFIAQMKKFGVKFKKETIVGLTPLGDRKLVQTRGGFYEAKAVVVATGLQKRQLSIPGEAEFKGRGVSYCTICDGPFFVGRITAVVGSGEDAVEEALRLAEVAEKVYAIPGGKGYKEGIEGLHELENHERIRIIEGVELEAIGGDAMVTHVRLKNGAIRSVDVDGVFIILENVATTDLIRDAGVETDGRGCIIVDKNQATNIPGIFAAGDCVCGGMQVVTAAGEGGRAGLSVLRYVRSLKK